MEVIPMLAAQHPKALVTVLTLREFGGVDIETFEVDHFMRPLFTDRAQVYTTRSFPEDASIKQVLTSLPVDVATWLHRSGVWESMPADSRG